MSSEKENSDALKSWGLQQLGDTNYKAWRIRMMAILKDKDLWEVVSGAEQKPEASSPGASGNQKEWIKKDNKALALIFRAVSDEQLVYIEDAMSAKEAWDFLRKVHVRDDQSGGARLLGTLASMRMLEGGDIIEHIRQFKDVLAQLNAVRTDKMSDNMAATFLLQSLPVSFQNLRQTIESKPENEVTLLYVIQKLYHEHAAIQQSQATEKEKVLMVHGGRSSRSKWKGKGAVRWSDNNQTGSSQTGFRNQQGSKSCWVCGSEGHFARKCPQRKGVPQSGKASGSASAKIAASRDDDEESIAGTLARVMYARIEVGESSHVLLMNGVEREQWLIDSGATHHLCNGREHYVNYLELPVPKKIWTANKQYMEAMGVGTISLNVNGVAGDMNIVLKDVLYVPECEGNLLSPAMLLDVGYKMGWDSPQSLMISKGRSAAEARRIGNHFVLDIVLEASAKVATQANDKLMTWHRRFGHLNVQGLRQLVQKGMVHGLPLETIKDWKLGICEGCLYGKQHRESFQKGMSGRASELLEIVHSDVVGPMEVVSHGGFKYFVTFTDDKSRILFTMPMATKDRVFSIFKIYLKHMERKTEKKLKILRSDNGGEYMSGEFLAYLDDLGIDHQWTARYTPEQNGVAERVNRTIVEGIRTMLRDSGLDKRWWGEALLHMMYLKNRMPTKALDGKTPYEAFHGKRPSVSNFRRFGCVAYSHIPKQLRRKLDEKTQRCLFLGYSDEVKDGYRLWDPQQKKIVIARDVIFAEEENFFQKGENQNISKQTTLVKFGVSLDLEDEAAEDAEMSTNLDENTDDSQGSNVQTPALVRDQAESNRSEEEETEADIITTSKYNLRTREPKDYKKIAKSGLYMMAFLSQAIGEPETFEEAIKCEDAEKWQAAMKDEICSIEKNKTWKLVPPPEDRKPVGCKWVFKKKANKDGKIERFKARLVARGFTQRVGVDFDEVFAPVAKFSSIRYLFARAALENLIIEQMDVVTAFLSGLELKEEVYMLQPKGFEDEFHKDWVLRIMKPLYGLKQAARNWYEKIDGELRIFGFKRCFSDHSIYVFRDREQFVIIVLYVDDLLFFANERYILKTVKDWIITVFEMKDLGTANFCLGIEIGRKEDGSIVLSQKMYIEKILERFGMQNAKGNSLPMPAKMKLEKRKDGEASVDRTEYQELIGSLMYAMIATRPDIAYTVGKLSQFCADPSETHYQVAKGVLKYLKATKDLSLVYGATGNKEIHGYTDSSWADNEDRRSTSGYVFILADGAITWSSKKQRCVTTSTMEAEYVAMASAVKEAVWLNLLDRELKGLETSNAMTVYSDSQSAMAHARNPTCHAKGKHIDISLHYTREVLERNEIELEYCATEEMVADGLTKALAKPKMQKLVKKMGLEI
jgi:Reverse transcriptase (RNA-dependent DNA polymerase)/gag-polypeptide of LTR copia-type/Pol polyprotein, beta-barrel domain/GAG-pre-integrase domain/Integrase core domain/Domain of unknown function (DUF4219)/Zinc knuckle